MTNTQTANHADRISAMHAWARASQIQRRGNRAITETWATPLRTVLVVIELDAAGNTMGITNVTEEGAGMRADPVRRSRPEARGSVYSN